MYDAIIVGARVAGAPTAMLLARAGHSVLLLDRDTFPSDTLSTHLIRVEGVGQLAFETYALIVAGVSVDHPVIRRNFAALAERVPQVRWTYASSCYVFALDAAIADLEQECGTFLGRHDFTP